jgi:hypothetical protein
MFHCCLVAFCSRIRNRKGFMTRGPRAVAQWCGPLDGPGGAGSALDRARRDEVPTSLRSRRTVPERESQLSASYFAESTGQKTVSEQNPNRPSAP